MNKLLTAIALTSIIALPALAARVRGKVLDENKQPLVGVTTQILEFPDSTRKGYSITNANGRFSYSNIKPGNYALHLSMVGMDDVYKNFTVSDTTTTVNLGNLVMTESAVTLDAAVITAIKAAVVAKEDTIEYNAGSYKTQANATVEDLLKKLPGVEVDSDGKITSGGKTISKILVDGKEFFGGDTQMATKNLPSELVDKIQVVDRKSDLARLTGVDDGEDETVINLSVKKGMKNGWFGTVGAGYGTNGRYEGRFNISTFTDNNQFSIVGGGNNINDLGFGDSGRGRFGGFGGSGGITEAQRIGLNFNVGKTDSLRFGGNVFYAHSNQNTSTTKHTFYQFADYTQTEDSQSKSWDIGHNVQGDFRMEWKMDPNNTLDFRPSFSFNTRDAESSAFSTLLDQNNAKINSSNSRRFNNGTNYDFEGRLIYVHNFTSKPGRSVSAHVRYEFSNNMQHNTSWSDIEYFMKNQQDMDEDDFERFYRFLNNKSWNNSIGARFTYTEPIGSPKSGNFLQFALRTNARFNNADKNTYDIPFPEGQFTESMVQDFVNIPENAVFDKALSNQFRNAFYTEEFQVGYKKVSKSFNLEAGVAYSPSGLESEDLLNSNKNISNWVWTNVAPFARMQFKFNKQSSLRIDYRGRSNQPSIAQLQPVEDVSDPMNITKGNQYLKPSFTQSMGIHLNAYLPESQFSAMVMMRGEYSDNDVVTRTVTDKNTGVRYTTYENANGNKNLFGMAMINQPVFNRMWRYSVRLGGNYSSQAGYINGDFNRSGNLRLRPSVGITFSSDLFQMSVNPTYSWQMSTSTLPSQRDRFTRSMGLRSDASLNLPFGLSLNSDLDYSKTTGMSEGMNADSWLLNAQISYSLLASKSLTLSVRGYDLLGMKKNFNRSSSAAAITDSSFIDLTRYVMFGVSYTFNTMKGKQPKNSDDFMNPHGYGPPPGMGRGMGRPPRH